MLNPLCYGLFALFNVRRQAAEHNAAAAAAIEGRLMLQVLRGVVMNPLFFSVLLGLAWNLAALGSGAASGALPWFLGDTLELLATSFLPTTYFVGGMTMVGCFSSLNSLRYVEVPMLMVAIKSLFLPFAAYALAYAWGASADERDFAFEYGLLPTASSSLVILQRFGLPEGMITTHNVALGLGRPFGFVLLFVYAAIATNGADEASHFETIARWSSTMHALSILGLGCVALLALRAPAYRRLLGRVVPLALLQLCFHLAFVAVGKTRVEALPSAGAKALTFSVVSVFRWAGDAFVVYLLLDDAGLLMRPACDAAGCFGPRRLLIRAARDGNGAGHEPLGASASDDGNGSGGGGGGGGGAGLAPLAPSGARASAAGAVAGALVVGLVLTLPWPLGGGDYPSRERSEARQLPFLPLWIPYVPSQAQWYAAVYLVLACAVGAALLTVLCRGFCSGDARIDEDHRHLTAGYPIHPGGARSDDASVDDERKTPPRNGAGGAAAAGGPGAGGAGSGADAASAPWAGAEVGAGGVHAVSMPPLGMTHRLRLFGAVVLLRLLGECALAFALAEQTPLGGVSREQLYLLVFLHDGQGILVFLLFGLHPRALQIFRDAWVGAGRALEPLARSLELNRGSLVVLVGVTLMSLAVGVLGGLIGVLTIKSKAAASGP